MLNSTLTVRSVGLEHTESVPFSEIYDRVKRGEVIVVPKCLQAIAYFDQLQGHNLPFSLESGASPCKSLPQLSVCDYVANGQKNEWQASNLCSHK